MIVVSAILVKISIEIPNEGSSACQRMETSRPGEGEEAKEREEEGRKEEERPGSGSDPARPVAQIQPGSRHPSMQLHRLSGGPLRARSTPVRLGLGNSRTQKLWELLAPGPLLHPA